MPDDKNNMPDGQGGGSRNKQTLLIIIVCVLISLVFMGVFNNVMNNSASEKISYDEFIDMVENNEVKKVELESGTLTITPREQKYKGIETTYSTTLVGDENSLAELLNAKNAEAKSAEERIEFEKIPPDPTSAVISTILSFIIPVVLLFVGFSFIMRHMSKGGGMMGVGKSKAKAYVQKETGITFKDVAGQDEAKESLQEVVEFLHNPGKYTQIGAKLPKGALLVGPPGTGKTLLAKAVAGEAHVPFFSLSGSEFVEMFVGVGASRVRDLFEEAKKNAPCIIFIDEIDAIGKTRDARYGGNDEREQTLNQLLAEMDGFDTSKGLLILAATNRPEVLDPALLRPGRFDRRVIVDRPDLKGRVSILKVHAKKVALDETVDFEAIALATSGAVGSDLANMINEAAILAVKNGRTAVSQKDLQEAVEIVLVGKEKKDRILSQEERRIVSYHEVGHALVSALQKDAEPVQKITIVPRTMGALGYVMQVPEEEKYLNTKAELDAMIVGLLAGRAAEELVFGNVTTGASNDIEKATKIVRAMITQYGMSEKFGLMGLASQENQYLDGKAYLNCGDATATEIDHEVMKVLKEAYEKAKQMLSENRMVLDRIAEYLIQKETITGKEFMRIFHEAREIQSGAALPVQEEKDGGIGEGAAEQASVPPQDGRAQCTDGESGTPEENGRVQRTDSESGTSEENGAGHRSDAAGEPGEAQALIDRLFHSEDADGEEAGNGQDSSGSASENE